MPGKNNATATTGEIKIIRDILMGKQMAEYQAQFRLIDENINAAKEQFSTDLKSMDDKTDARFASLEKEVNERFEKLEKLLDNHINRLDKKLIEITRGDKQDLGKMLANLSKKLMDE